MNYEMFKDLPDIMTVKQMQDALQIGRNTAYSIIKKNEIESIKIRNSIRITKKALEKYAKVCYNIFGVNDGYSLKEA